jgi:hypothetical protein
MTLAVLLASAEERQEQGEHVEYVEEDRRGRVWSSYCQWLEKRRAAYVGGAAQPLEVEHRQTGKDHETGDRVNERAVRDLHKHEHDPETINPASAQNKDRASPERSRRVA